MDVKVSYRRLPKGTYCKLQPRSQDFQGELAAEVDVDLRGERPRDLLKAHSVVETHTPSALCGNQLWNSTLISRIGTRSELTQRQCRRAA